MMGDVDDTETQCRLAGSGDTIHLRFGRVSNRRSFFTPQLQFEERDFLSFSAQNSNWQDFSIEGTQMLF
jgi:hypothetical protein